MTRLESGAAGGVIVFDTARFSQRRIEGERLIFAAQRGLVILDSEGDADLATVNGRKTFHDLLNAAAYESDRLSTRSKRVACWRYCGRRSFGCGLGAVPSVYAMQVADRDATERIGIVDEKGFVRDGRHVRSAVGDSPPRGGNDPDAGQCNDYELGQCGHRNPPEVQSDSSIGSSSCFGNAR